MGGEGFGQGLIQGLREGQNRQLEMARLKLEQDFSKSRQKQMEVEDQLKQLQLQSLQQKIEAEGRLPSMQANLQGPEAAPLGPQDQGLMPEAAPDIDRRKLVSFLQVAQQAGQDPNQLLQLMGIADPRIRAISESLQPEKLEKVGEGESLFSTKGGQARELVKGRPKPHVLAPGATLYREGEEAISAPAAPERPLVVPPGGSVLRPGEREPSFTAPTKPEKPVSVAPGGTLVNPETGATIFTAPAAPPHPPDFGDRLESAAAAYGQTTYGQPTTFTELLALDPIKASQLRKESLVDEPSQIAAARTEAILSVQQKKLLTPEEANKLGVPFGTTQEQAKGIMPITVQQREALAGYDTARTIIADIKQYSDRINTAAGGLKGRAEQAQKLWGAWTQSNLDAALLQSKTGELASIARSLGEKGALANQDVARAAALVPSIMDTREVAQRKFTDMMTIINKGEANFRKSLGIDARAPGTSKKGASAAPVPQAPEDPLASIPVPPGLTPQQEQVYRKAYAEERAKKAQQMQGATP